MKHHTTTKPSTFIKYIGILLHTLAELSLLFVPFLLLYVIYCDKKGWNSTDITY